MRKSKVPALKRSEIMRRIKSKGTRPEMFIRRLVHGMGYRYRLHRKELPGTPDLVFAARKKIIFIHGCFWHLHDCKRGSRVPRENREYWIHKLKRNQKRDQLVINELQDLEWKILVLWECQIKEKNTPLLKAIIKKFLDEP